MLRAKSSVEKASSDLALWLPFFHPPRRNSSRVSTWLKLVSSLSDAVIAVQHRHLYHRYLQATPFARFVVAWRVNEEATSHRLQMAHSSRLQYTVARDLR